MSCQGRPSELADIKRAIGWLESASDERCGMKLLAIFRFPARACVAAVRIGVDRGDTPGGVSSGDLLQEFGLAEGSPFLVTVACCNTWV